MRKVVFAVVLGLVMTPVMAEEDTPFAGQIKARQAFMNIYGFNIGILGAMARGKMPYDADAAQAAANNLSLASQMNNNAMWPPGSDASAPGLAGLTRAKAEAWAEGSDIGEKAQANAAAIADMAANAGKGLDALRSISRPYMFTASLPPAVIAAAQQSFDQIDANPQLRDRLWRNARILFDGLEALGFKLGPEVSPVVAIMLPGKEVAVRFWNALMEAGVYTNIAIPPSTPNALSLLRSSISAAHTRDQIATALDVFAQVGADLDLIPANKADRRRLAEAQGPLRIVTGGNAPAKPVQAPVEKEQRSSAAKG